MTGADLTFGLSRLDASALLSHGLKLQEVRELADVAMICAAMRATRGNQCAAARLLGVHRNTLWRTLLANGLPTKGAAWR